MKVLDRFRTKDGAVLNYSEGPGGAEITAAAQGEGKESGFGAALMFSFAKRKVSEARACWQRMTGRMPKRGRRR